eukprot:6654309-Ditylum_brightwellii.AAC.1
MLLASTDKRNGISIQPPYLKTLTSEGKHNWFSFKPRYLKTPCGSVDKQIDMLKTKMDKVIDYDFVTPFPKVEYIIDHKKKHCSKCRLTFYLVEG